MNRSIVALQRGFTLIELMIVVAIIGILAAIALPQYQTYMIKAKLVEATTDLDASKIAVTESYSSNNNTFPTSANAPIATVAPANHTYVTGIAYNGSAAGPASVVVTLGGTGNTNVDGKFLGIFGVGQTDGTVTWTCGVAAAATSTAVAGSAGAPLYPYIPAPCQH